MAAVWNMLDGQATTAVYLAAALGTYLTLAFALRKDWRDWLLTSPKRLKVQFVALVLQQTHLSAEYINSLYDAVYDWNPT